jgi:hypothetical protein
MPALEITLTPQINPVTIATVRSLRCVRDTFELSTTDPPERQVAYAFLIACLTITLSARVAKTLGVMRDETESDSR